MRKKILAIVMSLTMILAFMPAMAFADENEEGGSGVTSISYQLSDEGEAITIYEYQASDGYSYRPCQGDQLTVVTSDGETTYTYDEDAEAFISEDEDEISRDDVEFSLEQDEDSKYWIRVEYEGESTQITVEVVQNNVSSITYTPKATAITMYEGVDEIDDDGATYYDVASVYSDLYGFWNDEVEIEYNDGTATETVTLDELDSWYYVTEQNNKYVSLYEAQQVTAWAVGDTYEIYLKARGTVDTTNKITVTIESNPYDGASLTFDQSEDYLYVFETEMLEYDEENDKYTVEGDIEYYGSEGDVLSFTLADDSTEKFEYGTITDDPDYPYGWSGFISTDASGNISKLPRKIMINETELHWTKDSDGHYVNESKLTCMGAVSNETLESYAGCQVWFDPNGGEGYANFGVPLGMSVNELISSEPGDFLSDIQPTRSGYAFSGWYEMEDPETGELKADPYDFDTVISEETFLYAKWVEEAGAKYKVSGNTYQVISQSGQTVSFVKAKNAKTVTVPATVKINGTAFKVIQINAKAFTGSKIRTVTIGKNVKTMKKNAFKNSKATKIIVKSKLLKKANVKGSLNSSKVKTVQVKVGTKAQNKTYIKKYKKIFTKANAGKKVTVK